MLPEYFGLIMDPFENGPDPRFLYMDPPRRNAFAQLLSGVYEGKGVILLACPRGLGKSTLIRHLADQLASLDSALVLYPGGVLNCRSGMTFPDILSACRGRFDRRTKAGSDEDRLMATLERAGGRGQAAVLLLDDADALDDEALLRLHRLSEPDGDGRRMMSTILVGSPGLAHRLEQLGHGDNERGLVDLLLELPPMRDRDIDRLIRHRLTVAGHGDGELISPVARAEVARRSRGNLMRANALCAAALALAEREKKSTVSRDLVERAADHVHEADDEEEYGAGEGPHPGPSADDLPRAVDSERPMFEPVASASRRDEIRRLDDVAEAIRAADLRSSGGIDPHIKYGPAPSRSPGERGHDHMLDQGVAAPQRQTQPEAEYRVYPGSRPSDIRPARRRGQLGKIAGLGLVLALIAAAGIYALRDGMVDMTALGQQVQVLAAKVVRLVSNAVEPGPAVDEGVAGVDAPSPASGGDEHTTDLSFDRFGAVQRGEKATPAESYDYAPPPPQAQAEPSPAAALQSTEDRAQPSPVAPPPARGGAAGSVFDRGVTPKPSPAASPPAAPPPSASSGQGDMPARVGAAEPPPAPVEPAPAEPAPAASTAEKADLLDPGSAVVLARRGPPEAAKPPPPSAERSQAAQPAPAAAPPSAQAPAPPAATQAPAGPRPQRQDAGQAQFEPLLARGDEYLGTADLDMARTFYQMAYERGSAEAAIRMGWTFDPQYFQRMGVRGEASPREAILWYQEALRRGSRQASERLSDLATWLQSAAAAGDVEAQRILKLWQG
jgi:MSHA biogenesis protein MshM